MKRTSLFIPALVALSAAASTALAQQGHTMLQAGDIEWAPGPPSIPEGAQAAVLYGDPTRAEDFALRLKLPAGYVLPAHTHPKPEIVTVISGTFELGMGKHADRDDVTRLEAGSFFAFPPGMAHYAYTNEETVIQLNSTGPWSLDYINPEEDPRRD